MGFPLFNYFVLGEQHLIPFLPLFSSSFFSSRVQLSTLKNRVIDLENERDDKVRKLSSDLEALRTKYERFEANGSQNEEDSKGPFGEMEAETEKERRLVASNRFLNDLLAQSKKDRHALQEEVCGGKESETGVDRDSCLFLFSFFFFFIIFRSSMN